MGLAISSWTDATLRVVASSLIVIGLLLTILRLAYRIWLRRFWLEDAWAVVAFVCGISALTTHWTYVNGAEEVVVVSFWIYSISFTSTIWAVRQSILFSIVRVVHETQHLRRWLLCLGAMFFAMWAGLVIQKAWQYGHTGVRHPDGTVYAYTTQPTALYEISTDCSSDAILIVLPLRLLWSLKLPKRQKRMILATFTSSIFVTTISIFRSICQIQKNATVMSTATDFEIASSLFVCNLLVIVTFLYRIFGFVDSDDGASSSDDDYTTRIAARTTMRTTTHILTTIELDNLGTGSNERTKSRTVDFQ